MASLNVTCIPKNTELLWLQGSENQHRSFNLFTQGAENKLKVRRSDSGLSNHLKTHGIDEDVFEHVNNANFGGVLNAGIHKIDHRLILALVERWHPETHTFHFPIGEATVTLQDVQVIWGLPIDGPVVSGSWSSSNERDIWSVQCHDCLGFVPDDEEELKDGRIKISTLVKHLSDPLDDNDEAHQQRARTYILSFIVAQLFVDSNYHDVSLNYLQNLDDLSREGRKSWGGAVIACLYRNLCKATKPETKGIQGPLLLLQLWAWERMPHIAPRIVRGDHIPPYNFEECYAARWDFNLSHTETPAHVRSTYRSFFTALTNEQFLWTPYDDIIDNLPEDCRDGRDIWRYTGCLVFWSTVEPHLPERVARQFGIIQSIPSPVGLLTPQEHTRLHATRRGGSGEFDWVQRHRKYIAEWAHRRDRVFQGEPGINQTVEGYMQWYHERTVLSVIRPGNRGPNDQYPAWGPDQQLMYEGLREVADRARQFQDREPTQTQMFQEFVNIPQQIFDYNDRAERMHYSSQNIQFPPTGAYYPNTSGGAYHQSTPWVGASSSGNQHIFRNPSPNMGFMTPVQSTAWDMSNMYSPDINMDPYNQHYYTDHQIPHVNPVPMQDFSAPGSSSHQVATNLGDNEDEENVQQPLERRRRRRNRPPCGTGGHR